MNYVGSQALIDRRRKIKDHKGAETAMMSALHALLFVVDPVVGMWNGRRGGADHCRHSSEAGPVPRHHHGCASRPMICVFRMQLDL